MSEPIHITSVERLSSPFSTTQATTVRSGVDKMWQPELELPSNYRFLASETEAPWVPGKASMELEQDPGCLEVASSWARFSVFGS